MRSLIRSYLDFARGEKRFTPWILLYPLGLVSRAAVSFRNFCYDHGMLASYEAEIPVISVGNITFGGTNKTPFVEMLASYLEELNIKTGIISRGYGGNTETPVIIKNGNATRSLVGDEPLLLSSRLPGIPVAVSKDRLGDVTALAGEKVEVVIADDAFQHRKLGRDVDIVLVDATSPFGNGLYAPAGILRESPRSLGRAHIVVLTKANQVSPKELAEVKGEIKKRVPAERIFSSVLELSGWALWDGKWQEISEENVKKGKYVAFSAIGSPSSFWRFLSDQGVPPVENHFFKDHHRFTEEDMANLKKRVKETGANGLVCTEKDIHNIPEKSRQGLKLLVPRIRTSIKDRGRFLKRLAENLKPRVIVTSNGHGEDSIGALLARKLKARFPEAEITAFPIVGSGEHYRTKGIKTVFSNYVSPTGGVIKYSFRDLWKDLRAGLIRDIMTQFRIWKQFRGKVRTVICVGDIYLLLHALWGQGQLPVLVATAKTVYLKGHWRIEHYILKKRCRKVWTRDPDTARDISASGGNAVFEGNPIMDLVSDNYSGESPWEKDKKSARILLLPGSRHRAYRDMNLLLETALHLDRILECQFVAVIAPTIELEKISGSNSDWHHEKGNGDFLEKRGTRIKMYQGPLPCAASDATILVGLGGTANQVCAGLGIPVVSVKEKGKMPQKKLLGEAEVLVERNARALAHEVEKILSSEKRYRRMAETGRKRLGSPGALDSVIESLMKGSGWETRNRIQVKLAGYSSEINCPKEVTPFGG